MSAVTLFSSYHSDLRHCVNALFNVGLGDYSDGPSLHKAVLKVIFIICETQTLGVARIRIVCLSLCWLASII